MFAYECVHIMVKQTAPLFSILLKAHAQTFSVSTRTAKYTNTQTHIVGWMASLIVSRKLTHFTGMCCRDMVYYRWQ